MESDCESDSNYEPEFDELEDEEKKKDKDKNCEKRFKCDFPACNASFIKPYLLRRHLNTHNNVRRYKCKVGVCKQAFTDLYHLKRHLLQMHKIENYEPEHFEDLEIEEDKGQNDQDIMKHKCNFPGCSATFRRPFRLQQHLNSHNNERPYKCTFEGCDKAYGNQSHLKRHLQTHSVAAKSYTCQFCYVKISTLSNLKRHYNRIHNTDRELYCTECKLAFRKKNRYDEHIAAHKNLLIYKCDKCGKSFLTHMKLRKHQEFHIIKNYECPVENCTKVFEKWALMVKHKRTEHVIEYPCTKCNKIFSSRSHLKSHSKIHLDDRPAIPCPYDKCNHLYYFKRNLDNHIRIKHIGKKFECDMCGLKLASKQKIELHVVHMHLMKKKPFKRKVQAPRKDTGQAKLSALSVLTGIHLSVSAEIQLMKRNPTALVRDNRAVDNSVSEDDRLSDTSAKGA